MFRSRSRRFGPALLVPLLVLVVTSGLVGTSASAQSTSSGRRPNRPQWHDVTFTNTAPPITIGTPQCDAGGQCLYPWTEAGVSHGDFEGTYIASGAATASAGHAAGP